MKTSWTIPRLIEELTRGLASGEYSSEGLAVDLRGRPVVGCEAGVDGAAALVIEWPESEEEAARTMQREWQRLRESQKRLIEGCAAISAAVRADEPIDSEEEAPDARDDPRDPEEA